MAISEANYKYGLKIDLEFKLLFVLIVISVVKFLGLSNDGTLYVLIARSIFFIGHTCIFFIYSKTKTKISKLERSSETIKKFQTDIFHTLRNLGIRGLLSFIVSYYIFYLSLHLIYLSYLFIYVSSIIYILFLLLTSQIILINNY